MNEYKIKEISEINERYSGSEWKYVGEDENLRGRIWRFDCSYPDNRRGCVVLKFSSPISRANMSSDVIAIREMVSVSSGVFKKYFVPYKRQNIVAEEKPNKTNDQKPNQNTCKENCRNKKCNKTRTVPFLMTNKEIEDEIELERNGWTEKEIQNEINKNRKRCGCDKCHGTKLTDDEILATLLFNLCNLSSFFR